MRRILYTTLVASAVFAGSYGFGAAKKLKCISDWSVAAPIVKKEGLVAVETLSKAAPSKFDGDIVKATLCRENDAYVFQLVLKGAGGQLRSLTVDARRPFGR